MTKSVQHQHYPVRYWFVIGGFLLLVSVVVGRLLYLQIESQSFLIDQGERRVLRVVDIPGRAP